MDTTGSNHATVMTFREMNIRVFEGKFIPHVLFQPRFEPWYAWHEAFGKLPPRYEAMGLRGMFDDLGVSMRYLHYYTGMPDPITRRYDDTVHVHEDRTGDHLVRVFETPHGKLTERYQMTVDRVWRQVGFPVKTVEGLRALRWLLERTTYGFSSENFAQGSTYVGPRGEPQFWVPKSPYQALAQQWMKLEDLIYLLMDHPSEVEATFAAIDAAYDTLYEELGNAGVVRIINFGENIHDSLISPRYFERYFVPFYEKRVGQLHEAGIYAHVHIDGFFSSLLPFLKDLPFDGYEALTPEPQGDVT
ncbi:MAG: hypothetical protein J7M15_04475, partial [Anaerolineae bacterium]|nr:hypothetical protein [Anaerolineae bacterium]